MAALCRAEALAALARGVDVLVVGGGITGAGVALDAASRGYRVGLVERQDFASGTSSRSTRLIHGGIRYLPQGHLHLVSQALQERKRLLRLAPHLVHPLGFVVPLYAGTRRPLGIQLPRLLQPFAALGVRLGLLAYDVLARDPRLRHRVLKGEALAQLAPDLRREGLRRAFLYFDARTDDVRLTHAVLATARAHGAVTLNYAEVAAFLHRQGRVAGAGVVDRLSGRSLEVPARAVVNATGIWAEQVAAWGGPPPFHLRHSKGVHLVLRPGAVRASAALVIPETDDGRLAFVVPWRERFVLGTTDTPYHGELDAPGVEKAEVDYLLEHANRYLTAGLRPQDVVAAYAGIRPLVSRAQGPTASLPRDHVVVVSGSGLITVTGGKLATYRRMAQDAVDAVVRQEGRRRPCRTHRLPLAGAAGLEAADAALPPLAPASRTHLLETYGSLARDVVALAREDERLLQPLIPGLPHLAAEVVYGCRAEQLVSLADCLFLRTRLALLDPNAADAVAPQLAILMAKELGWDEAEVARQLAQYRARRRLEAPPPAGNPHFPA
ncbi:MAG: glycerol-3-phosphate dehydrogenase [Candidatus Tectimicrobiota bacterium]|nr:MAG: glycerol-3-phosphate dehydrogenase [Candidatus Tectomicrobia bacterium]